MSLQGPIVVVAEQSEALLLQALTGAGAFPVIEAQLADAPAAVASIKPSAVVLAGTEPIESKAAQDLAKAVRNAEPFLPLFMRIADGHVGLLPGALPIPADLPPARLISRIATALRLRALHATVLGRAKTLKTDRNIIADLPAHDALDDATVLVVGRGRSHPALSVAVGERMAVMGALSVEAAARCLNARHLDGIVVGDGLPAGSVDAFLTVLAEDVRFRDLPVALLGSVDRPELPNAVYSRDPQRLIEGLIPLVQMHAFEAALKRLLKSIESKGMLEPQTGLFNNDAFERELTRVIADATERSVGLSLARFAFEGDIDRRTHIDAARLIGRLIRDVDFACRQDDNSMLVAFIDTDLRAAHVVARRLASVLKHTALRPNGEKAQLTPSVTLATLRPNDTMPTLLARVAPQRVAAE